MPGSDDLGDGDVGAVEGLEDVVRPTRFVNIRLHLRVLVGVLEVDREHLSLLRPHQLRRLKRPERCHEAREPLTLSQQL